jgi:hypothetical protein
MKSFILTHSIAALLLAIPLARAQEKKPEGKKNPGAAGASASTSVVASGDGTATVTIDINGKKETRTFKLGDGNHSFSFSTSGEDGATVAAGGGVGFDDGVQVGGLHRKSEKGPWLGIGLEPVSEPLRAQLSLAKGEGIVINHVAPEGPAARAGLLENDILLRFDEQILVEGSQLRKLIAMKKPGDTVKLVYMRKGERKEASATLIEHEIEAGEQNPFQWFQAKPGGIFRFDEGQREVGERLQELQEKLKGLKEKHPGVIVDKRSWLSKPGAPGAPLPPAPPAGPVKMPGGPGAGNPDQFRQNLDHMRKQLESMKLPAEEMERIRKSLDEAGKAAEQARAAFDGAVKGFGFPPKGEAKGGEGRKGEGKKGEEPPKPPGKKPVESL